MDAAPFATYVDGATVEAAFHAPRRRHDPRASCGSTVGPNDYIVIRARPIPLAGAQLLAELLLAGQRLAGAQSAYGRGDRRAHALMPRSCRTPRALAPPGGWLFVGWTHH